MAVERITANIYRIPVRLPNNPLKELNSYFIRDRERSLLIDTGFRRDTCREDLLAGLAELGADRDRMDIFLTHMHSDHAGLAGEIIAPGGKIYVGETDMPYLSMDGADLKSAGDTMRSYKQAGVPLKALVDTLTKNPAVKYAPPVGKVTYTPVAPGTRFEKGGCLWECIWTPGHTPGHLCLWNEESGILFCGDHVLFGITPNITRWPKVADSLGDYLKSLEMIGTYDVRLALPGHRKSGDFHARVAALLAHHEERAAEVVQIVAEEDEKGLTAYEIAGRMHWDIKAEDWDHFPPSQKFFAIGEAMSHLDYLVAKGSLRTEQDRKKLLRYHIA